MDVLESARQVAREQAEEHSHGEVRPLGGYAVLLTTYLSSVTAMAFVVRRRKALITRPHPADLAMIAVATHKVARMLAKDSVLATVRMPFTRYEEPAGLGEVNESVRVHGGVRHALGELVTCPFCLAQWVATAFTFGLLLAPRATRQIASVFCAVTASDYLQIAYVKAEQSLK